MLKSIYQQLNQHLNLRMNWEKLGPNLNFTVENIMVNLHKMKLATFQI